MARANTLVFLALTILALALLWLWYALGFVFADRPLDLVVAIVWLLVILACSVLLIRVEVKRRRSVRTLYLADGKIFSLEGGVVHLKERNNVTGALVEMLDSLTYTMAKPALQAEEALALNVEYVVKSHRFAKSGKVWEGEVVMMATRQVKAFASRSELARIIIPATIRGRRSESEIAEAVNQ